MSKEEYDLMRSEAEQELVELRKFYERFKV
mgnify:CR=1 FL=1